MTYSIPDLEPVCCPMSSSNCCFLTCIQISQEAGQVVWYSHLFKNFPKFVVIHTKRIAPKRILIIADVVHLLSCVRLFVTSWTEALQAPPSMGFSRQEYWSRLALPPAVDLPDPGIELVSPALLFFFSCSVMFNSLRPHGLQHIRLPCPSLSPGACSNSCPLSQ